VIDRGRVIATDTPANLSQTVGAAEHYELEFSGDPVVVEIALRHISQVQEVELMPINHLNTVERRLMMIRSSGGQDIGSEIITALVQQGIQVHELHRSRANLEEIFLALTNAAVTEQA
jgi:ABC-2 type transport system ATP-binding protein